MASLRKKWCFIKKRLELDKEYLEKRGIIMDFKILIKTVFKLFKIFLIKRLKKNKSNDIVKMTVFDKIRFIIGGNYNEY